MAGALRYFSVEYGDNNQITIVRSAKKETGPREGGASLFLDSVRSVLSGNRQKINIPSGLSLQDIVAKVVSGYEAKKGVLQRIYDCMRLALKNLLGHLGIRIAGDQVTEYAEAIKATGITSSTLLPAPFKRTLVPLIEFLHKLPPAARELFTEWHELGKNRPKAVTCCIVPASLTFPYCDPQNPQKPRDIQGLNTDQLIALGHEINWYLSALMKERSKGYESKHYEPFLQKIDRDTFASGRDSFFIYASNYAVDKNDRAANLDALMQIRDHDRCPQKLLTAQSYFAQGNIEQALLALSGQGFCSRNKEAKELTEAIKKALLEKPLTKESVFLICMMVDHQYKRYFNHEHLVSLVDAFVKKCLNEKAFIPAAIAAVKQLELVHGHRERERLLKHIGETCLAAGDIPNVEAVLGENGFESYTDEYGVLKRGIARCYLAKNQFAQALDAIRRDYSEEARALSNQIRMAYTLERMGERDYPTAAELAEHLVLHARKADCFQNGRFLQALATLARVCVGDKDKQDFRSYARLFLLFIFDESERQQLEKQLLSGETYQ